MSVQYSTMAEPTLEDAFRLLSIDAVLFCALNALFGIYFVFFCFAVWSTYRFPSAVQTRQRAVTVALFVVLCVHYFTRSAVFAGDRKYAVPKQPLGGPVPLLFISSMMATTAGLLADGILVWRMYVVYGRVRWALYVPAAAVIATALVGYASNFLDLVAYQSMDAFEAHYEKTVFEVNAAWGWSMFAVHTVLTGSIIARIIYSTRKARHESIVRPRIGPHSVLLEAIVESALVSWVGLLLYGITAVAPEGHITTDKNIGFVMQGVVPLFFGTAQSLVTVRLGVQARPDSTWAAGASTQSGASGRRGIFVHVQRATRTDSQAESFAHDKRDVLCASEHASSVAHVV